MRWLTANGVRAGMDTAAAMQAAAGGNVAVVDTQLTAEERQNAT